MASYVWDEKMGRRKFLKAAGLVAGGAALTGGLAGCGSESGPDEHALAVNAAGEEQWGREAGAWIESDCNMCGGQCGIFCHVVDGVVQKIEPNNWDPCNYANVSGDFYDGYTEEYGVAEGGRICPKGNAGIMQLYDPDRVQRPMKRTNPEKGRDVDPGWEEISWEQAVDEIAEKLDSLRSAGEAHKLLWWSEDHSFVDPQADFCTLFGTPNYSNHSNLCDATRKASFRMAMGDERPLPDFSKSKYIILFGWNPTSAMKWVLLSRIIPRAVENGARLVVVDPYMSDTAAKAHEWVSILPATDGAMALAMAHVIIRDDLYDKRFVADWTVGFDEYRDYVKDKTPEWAEKITTVPAKTIERIAREVATTQPSIIDVWSGPGQHSNGTQGGRAIALLTALVGGYDQPGRMLIPDRRGGAHTAFEPSEEAEVTLAEARYDGVGDLPVGHGSGCYGRGFQRMLDGDGPYEPKVGMCVFQNLVMNGPGSWQIEEALKKLEMFVVVDTMVSETALMADYLIPGTVYLERYDLNTRWVTWPSVGLRQPVVKAAERQTSPYPYQGGIFGQMAEYEFVASLGRKLGLKTADGMDFFLEGRIDKGPIRDLTRWYEDYLSMQLKNGSPAMTLAALRELPGAVFVDKGGTRYKKYEERIPGSVLATAFVDGDLAKDGTAIYDAPEGKRIGTVIGGKPVRGFMTPSGRVEFYGATWATKKDVKGNRVDALPVYKPRGWQPDSEFPLYLIHWKEASHTHTRTHNNAWLLGVKPDNPLIIHPDAAEEYGIDDGDEVWVESPYNRGRTTAKVTYRMHPEVVGVQHGFGHWAGGELAAGRGIGMSDLNTINYDVLSGMALHKEICCKVYKV